MRSLVVGMVGMVGVWVYGVVCLVSVLFGGCGVIVFGVRGVIVERWGVGLGMGCVGDWGVLGEKTYYLVTPFEIADFRGE